MQKMAINQFILLRPKTVDCNNGTSKKSNLLKIINSTIDSKTPISTDIMLINKIVNRGIPSPITTNMPLPKVMPPISVVSGVL